MEPAAPHPPTAMETETKVSMKTMKEIIRSAGLGVADLLERSAGLGRCDLAAFVHHNFSKNIWHNKLYSRAQDTVLIGGSQDIGRADGVKMHFYRVQGLSGEATLLT